jgi:hypothetical protein
MHPNKKFLPLLVFSIGIALGASACAEQADPEAAAESAPAEEVKSLMETPMDGSSVEAFEAGMEALRAEDEAGYKRLKSALEYKLVYDLAAKRDKGKLYQSLDGKTPREIIGDSGYAR